MEEVKRHLHDLLKTVRGLHAIVVSDREGVPLIRVFDEVATDTVALRPPFLSSAGIAMEQAGKLGLGSAKSIVYAMQHNQVLHFNQNPLVVTMIADDSANTGLLMNLNGDLESLIAELHKCIA